MTQQRRPRRARGNQPGRLETRLTVEKSVSFHADGVWGGLTSKGQIVMGFYTEQFGAPEKITYELPKTLPDSLKEVSRQGGGQIFREVQAQVFMSLDVARSLIPWLEEHVKQGTLAEEQTEAAPRTIAEPDNAVDTILVGGEDDN